MKTPAQPEKYNAAAASAKDDQVAKMVPDRSQKFQAPEPLRPTNRFSSPQGSWKHFQESRRRTIEYARKEAGMRTHFLDSPAIKDLDAYAWLLYLSAHSERHTAQIREVKADAKFPKKPGRY